MFEIIAIPTEQTTAATNIILMSASFAGLILLTGSGRSAGVRLWRGFFVLSAAAAFFGIFVHGLVLSDQVYRALWWPVYCSIGAAMGCMAGAALWQRFEFSGWGLAALSIAVGGLAGILSRTLPGGQLLFISYVAAALLFSTAIYGLPHRKPAQPSSRRTFLALTLMIAAGLFQVMETILSTPAGPLDENGLFHLVQAVAMVVLARAIRIETRR